MLITEFLLVYFLKPGFDIVLLFLKNLVSGIKSAVGFNQQGLIYFTCLSGRLVFFGSLGNQKIGWVFADVLPTFLTIDPLLQLQVFRQSDIKLLILVVVCFAHMSLPCCSFSPICRITKSVLFLFHPVPLLFCSLTLKLATC